MSAIIPKVIAFKAIVAALLVTLQSGCSREAPITTTYEREGFSVSVPEHFQLIADTTTSMFATREVAFVMGKHAAIDFFLFPPTRSTDAPNTPDLATFADLYVALTVGEANEPSLSIKRVAPKNGGFESLEYAITEDYLGEHTRHLKVLEVAQSPVAIFAVVQGRSRASMGSNEELAAIVDSVEYHSFVN